MARIRDIVIDCANAPALGATVRDEHQTFKVMQDPEGNEFCIRDPD